MKKVFKALTFLSMLLSIAPFIRPESSAGKMLLWFPKLIGGALSPLLALSGGLGAWMGLINRDWKLAAAGGAGLAMAAKFMNAVPSSEEAFDEAFGTGWPERIPEGMRPLIMPARWSPLARAAGEVDFQQNVVVGRSAHDEEDLLADLWQPAEGGNRSGMGLIYVHGSGWRVGDKDMGTRSFFRRLAGQGHVVLDIAYTLFPQAVIPEMVAEINQSILWLKKHGPEFGVDPERIVLIGGSAGAHLALLAAYAPDQAAFQPPNGAGDTSVRGVVAFYPPVDLQDLYAWAEQGANKATGGLQESLADELTRRIFMLSKSEDAVEEDGRGPRSEIVAELCGGSPEEIPDTYRLLSPIKHVGPDCPPTLLLQGSDDVFDLAPGVRELNEALCAAGVQVVSVEFPHTEHAFDLVLPQISPVAQAAIYDVERFLALLL